MYSARQTDKIAGIKRSQRQSEYLGVREVSNTLNAARIADKIGEPINIMLTVNLTLLGKTNPNVDDVAAALAGRFRKWVTRPGKKANSAQPLKARYFWTAENPTHTNLHFAVHVPSGREIEFDKKARRWGNPPILSGVHP